MGKTKDYIKISEFKSEALRALAKKHNTERSFLRSARLDGHEISAFVNDAEFYKLKNDVANENDDIKRLLGFASDSNKGISSEQTTPTPEEKVDSTPQIQVQGIEQEARAERPAQTAEDAYKEVRAAYERIRGYDSTTGKTNGIQSKTAYKAVKEAYEDKGKVYEEALKQLKYDYKHGDARIAAANAIRAAKATDADGNVVDPSKLDIDTSKEVREYAIEYLKSQNNGVLDEREYRALKGNDKNVFARAIDWIGGNDSHQKKLRKGVAADNSAAKARRNDRFTIADMKKAIGNKCPFLQENVTANGFTNVTILEAAGLIKEEKDSQGKGTGKYNISELSMLIRRAIGPDATLNDHDDEAMRETQSLRTDLGQAFEKAGVSKFIDVSKLTNRDLRQLVEFCKYYSDRAHNIIVETYQGLGIGAATGAALGSSSISSTSHTEQEVKGTFNVGNAYASEFERQLKENIKTSDGGTITTQLLNGGATVYFKVSQISDSDSFIGLAKTALTAEMLGTLIGGAVGGATAFVHALATHKKEDAVFDPTKLSCFETYEEALAFVDSQKDMSEEQKRTLRALLLQGVELVTDEHGVQKAKTIEVTNPVTHQKECKIAWKLQCCDELNRLLRVGGNGIPNPRELDLSVQNVSIQEKPVEKADCDPKPVVETPVVREERDPQEKPFTAQERITEYTGEKTRGVRWDALAKQYDCLEQYVPKYSHRVRMMKVMQGVNNNDYTLENLKKLTELSFKVGANLEKLRSPNKNVQKAELERITRELVEVFKDVKGFDTGEYIKTFTGDIIGEQKVPDIIINDTTKCVRNKQIKAVVDRRGSGGNSIRSGMAKDESKELDVPAYNRTFRDGEQQQAMQFIKEKDASGTTPYDRQNSKTDRYFNGEQIK